MSKTKFSKLNDFLEVNYTTGEVRNSETKQIIKNIRYFKEDDSVREVRVKVDENIDTEDYLNDLEDTTEEWLPIEGYESTYLVSNLGNIINKRTGKLLGLYKKPNGYLYTQLSKNGANKKFYIHRLVGKAFIDNPKGLATIDHINSIKTDNRVENLRWMSREDNARQGRSKIVEQYSLETGELIATYPSITEASRVSGVSIASISQAINGSYKRAGNYTWKKGASL